MDKTIEKLDIRFERMELTTIEDLPQEVVDRIEDSDDYEYRSDWQHFFDLDFKDVLAGAIRFGGLLVETWDFVTVEAALDDDYAYEGYVVVFCSTTIRNAVNDVVKAEIKVNDDAKVVSVKIGDEL